MMQTTSPTAPPIVYPLVWHVDGSLPYLFNPNDHSGPQHPGARRAWVERETLGWMTLLKVRLLGQLDHRTEWERDLFRTAPLTLGVAITFPQGKRRWDDDNALAATKHPRDLIGTLLGRSGDRGIVTERPEQYLWSSVDKVLRAQYPDGWTTFTVAIREATP